MVSGIFVAKINANRRMLKLSRAFFVATIFILFLLVFASCSSVEESEYKKFLRKHEITEEITRGHKDRITVLDKIPKKVERIAYPFDKFPRCISPVTKEDFRCKGSLSSVTNCGSHSLPIENGKEFISSVLLEILNAIQIKLGSKVTVSSGHRCLERENNIKEFKVSKHNIGYAVDFYVQGYEYNMEKVMDAIALYYEEQKWLNKKDRSFKGQKVWGGNLRTSPYFNKEVLIQLFCCDEGRSADNSHDHEYIHMEILYDRTLKREVKQSWQKASNIQRQPNSQ